MNFRYAVVLLVTPVTWGVGFARRALDADLIASPNEDYPRLSSFVH